MFDHPICLNFKFLVKIVVGKLVILPSNILAAISSGVGARAVMWIKFFTCLKLSQF